MGMINAGGRCPKCGGNLYLDRDYNGWYEQCLQCAYINDLAIVYQSGKKTEKEAVQPVRIEIERDKNEKDTA